VLVFEGLLTDGLNGAPFAPAARFVSRTWVAPATSVPNPQPGQLALQ